MKSSQTLVILLLALTTVGGATLAWRQYGELVELRAAAMNRDERADMQKRIWELEKLNRDLQDQLAAARDADEDVDDLLADAADGRLDGNGASRDRGARSDRKRGSDGRQQIAAMRELMSKPEVQAMLSIQQKAAIEARYAALFKKMNLSTEQADKLKSLLAERGNTRMDVMVAAREQGIDPRQNPEAIRKLFADVQEDLNQGIKAVIGEQGFAELQTYEKTMPQRNLVENLQDRLSYTSMPLTDAQAEQLVQILATNTPQPQGSNTAAPRVRIVNGQPLDMGMVAGVFGPGDRIRGGAPVTAEAISQAQTVLAPPQIAALQGIQQQQQTQQSLQQMIRETLTASKGNKAGAATGTTTAAPEAPSGGQKRRRGGG